MKQNDAKPKMMSLSLIEPRARQPVTNIKDSLLSWSLGIVVSGRYTQD